MVREKSQRVLKYWADTNGLNSNFVSWLQDFLGRKTGHYPNSFFDPLTREKEQNQHSYLIHKELEDGSVTEIDNQLIENQIYYIVSV